MREIEQEVYTEPETAQKKDTKQTAAVDLSKRLKDFRSLNDASSMKGFSLSSYEPLSIITLFYVQTQATNTEKNLHAHYFPVVRKDQKNLFRKFLYGVLLIIFISSYLDYHSDVAIAPWQAV